MFATYFRKSEKLLALAVLAGLLGGGSATVAEAHEFSTPMHRYAGDNWESTGTKTGEISFTFKEDSTISLTNKPIVDHTDDFYESGSAFTVKGDNVTVTGKTVFHGAKFADGLCMQSAHKSFVQESGKMVLDVENIGKNEYGSRTVGLNIYNGCQGSVTFNGDLDLKVTGPGEVYGLDSYFKTEMEFNGDTAIEVNRDAEKSYAIHQSANQSTVSINCRDGAVKDPSKTTRIKGDVFTRNHRNGYGYNGNTVNLGFAGKDSLFQGILDHEEKFWNEKDPYFGNDEPYGRTAGDITMVLQDGALWIHEKWGDHDYSEGFATTGSLVTTFRGGQDDVHAGIIRPKDSAPITFKNYAGAVNVVYEHNAAVSDVTDPGFFTGGNIHIWHADADSSILAITSSDGIEMKDEGTVRKALNTLAGKVYYQGHVADGYTDPVKDAAERSHTPNEVENNLKGQVRISSGLTSDAQWLRLADMDFDDADGHGYLKADTAVTTNPDAEPGDPGTPPDKTGKSGETPMMRGVRAAVTTVNLAWRDNVSDTFRVASRADSDGIFARLYGGRAVYDKNGLDNRDNYKGFQAGYDKDAGNGWHAGIAFDYRDGSSDYLLDGEGDSKLYSAGIYGVKTLRSGAEFRLAAKAGRVKNDYTVHNEIGETLKGDMAANALGITAEYGKRFSDGENYITPSAQLSFARVGSKDYTASAGEKELRIAQDAYDSVVGRLALEAGCTSARSALFARLGLAHEFSGDIEATYKADDGGIKSTSFEGKDTWGELSLGGRYLLSDVSDLQLEITRDFGGDFHHKWNINAGLRFSF